MLLILGGIAGACGEVDADTAAAAPESKEPVAEGEFDPSAVSSTLAFRRQFYRARAEGQRALRARVAELFADASEQDLQTLLLDEDTGVALLAAWERVLRRGPVDGGRKADPVELARFIGFVEGRVQAPVPDRWADVIGASEGAGFRFEGGLRGDDRAAFSDEQVTVTHGDEVWVLPRWRFGGGLAMAFDGGSAYLAGGFGIPVSYAVYEVDRLTGEPVRAFDVWAGEVGYTGSYEGLHAQFIEMSIWDSVLVVFGCSNSVAYIEAFDLETGEPLYRFGTNYLDSVR